jgi:hypothetical protein
LGAYQHTRLGRLEPAQQRGDTSVRADRVRVETEDGKSVLVAFKRSGEIVLDALGTRAVTSDRDGAALLAAFGRGLTMSAVMAGEKPVAPVQN